MSSVDEYNYSDEESDSGETLVSSQPGEAVEEETVETPDDRPSEHVITDDNVRCSNWMCTLNNYTDNEVAKLKKFECKYLAFGFEAGDVKNTPHLQIMFTLHTNPAKKAVLSKLHNVGLKRIAHLQACYAPVSAMKYALKGNDPDHKEWIKKPFVQNEVYEKGMAPRGAKTIAANKAALEDKVLAEFKDHGYCSNSGYQLRYYKVGKQIHEEEQAKKKVKTCLIVDLRPWQQELVDYVKQVPDSRKIRWYYDPVGGQGKSQMSKYLYENFEGAVFLRGGKDADQAMMLPKNPKIVVFDLAKAKNHNIQYGFIENCKDGTVESPKYESKILIFDIPHVIVFSNRLPEQGQMSEDRITVINL